MRLFEDQAAGGIPQGEIIVDSFAGGGGASTGIEMALGRSPDVAINHDPMAIAMHKANHPDTVHLSNNIYKVDPRDVMPGRAIGLFWASPDCTHHSKAKGGAPIRTEGRTSRDLGWIIVHWAELRQPRVIMLENVEEWQDWGPVIPADGGGWRPDPERKGETFKLWVRKLKKLGYRVEWRELRACDYGSPTIRKRLFVIARRDGQPIIWPAPTHGAPTNPDVISGKLRPWRTAAEIIDWSLPCPSIFDTAAEIMVKHGVRAKRPLAPATMARIAKGVKRYVLDSVRPFIVPVMHAGAARVNSVDEPLRTITTAHRGEHAVAMPFVSYGQQGGANRDATDPLHTVTASKKDTNAVVMPFVAGLAHGETHGRREYSAEEPVTTIHAGGGNHALIAPHVTKFRSNSVGHAADEPLHTITAHSGSGVHPGGAAPLGVVAPVLVGVGGRSAQSPPRSAEQPLATIVAKPDSAVVAPYLVPRYGERPGQEPRTHSIEAPAPVIVPDGNGGSLVAPLLVKNNFGEKPEYRADEPVRTIVAGGNHHMLIAPHLAQHNSERNGEPKPGRSVDEPVSTILQGGGHQQLVATHLQRQFGASVGGPADDPAGTITPGGGGKTALVSAFLAQHNNHRGTEPSDGRPVEEPASTVTTKGPQGVVAAHLLNMRGSDRRDGPADGPAPTASAQGNHAAAVAAFMVKYYGNEIDGHAADTPLGTVTTRDRAGLVTVTLNGEPYVIVDIGMRMLTARERFSAQGFPRSYIIDLEFNGKPLSQEAQGRMVGNSVCPDLACALAAANVSDLAAVREAAE